MDQLEVADPQPEFIGGSEVILGTEGSHYSYPLTQHELSCFGWELIVSHTTPSMSVIFWCMLGRDSVEI